MVVEYKRGEKESEKKPVECRGTKSHRNFNYENALHAALCNQLACRQRKEQ